MKNIERQGQFAQYIFPSLSLSQALSFNLFVAVTVTGNLLLLLTSSSFSSSILCIGIDTRYLPCTCGCALREQDKTMTDILPILLPKPALPKGPPTSSQWRPTNHLMMPQPPASDEAKQQELAMAAARYLADGKPIKKTRPRRTVDYMSGLGCWNSVRKTAAYYRRQRIC